MNFKLGHYPKDRGKRERSPNAQAARRCVSSAVRVSDDLPTILMKQRSATWKTESASAASKLR